MQARITEERKAAWRAKLARLKGVLETETANATEDAAKKAQAALTFKPGALAAQRLAPRTREQYARLWKKVTTETGCDAKTLNEEEYHTFLCARIIERDNDANTLRTYRAAVAHYVIDQTPPGKTPWVSEPGYQKRTKGIESVAQGALLPRGGITRDRLKQLKKECATHPKKVMYRQGFSLAYCALLRISELMKLKRQDLRAGLNDDLVVTVVGGKGKKMAMLNGRTPYAEVRVTHGAAFLEWFKDLKPQQLLFPEWDTAEAGKLIQHAAAKHEWHGELKFTFHSLRHGAAEDMHQEGMSMKDIMVKGRWAGYQSAEVYVRNTGAQQKPQNETAR